MTKKDDRKSEQHPKKARAPEPIKKSKRIKAEIYLTKYVIEGKEVFALNELIPTVPGTCAGKPEGSSCGDGCTCIGGQPTWERHGLTRLGITIQDEN